MRRITAGFIAFLALTGTLLVLPVYAAPKPGAAPVETAIDEVVLGSVTDPVGEAVVTTDGQVQPGGVDETEASATPSGAVPAGEVPADEPTTSQSAEPTAAPADEDVVSSGAELDGVPALTVSQPDITKFSTVGVTWRRAADVTDVVTQIRVQNAAGAWGAWTTLEPDDIEQTSSGETEDNDVRDGTAPYWTDDAYGIEVIVQGANGAVPEDVELALIDPGTSAADALPLDSGVQDEANAGTPMPAIIGRAQWGADESIRTWDPEYAPTIKAATLHHTADRNTYAAVDVPGMMRSIYAYHTQTRGWGDIGYNVIIDKFGRIFEGRYGGLSSTVIGAHAGGFNTGTFGVSMLGNYAEVDTPQALLDSVAAVMAWKLSLYGVNPYGTTQLTSGGGGTAKYAAGVVVTLPTIFGHRDVGNTTCPGQYAYNRMGQIRDAVAARFGPSGGSPVGNLEGMSVTGDRLDVVGWTYDPDSPTASIDVGVSVDGGWALSLRASGDRPDVAAAFPGVGAAHGFRGQLNLAPGKHTVCVVFVNGGPTGSNTWIRCEVLTAVNGAVLKNPVGNVEAVNATGRSIAASGWTVDPDALSSALEVHIYVNGQFRQAVVANGSRPDVAAAFPGAGAAHGFSWAMDVSAPGRYSVCVYAINQNQGTQHPLLRCADAVVSTAVFAPVGHLDSVLANGPTARLAGWALDPDAPTQPLSIHVYIDGRFNRAVTADAFRPDVGAAFPGHGNQHGFGGSVTLAPGYHTVCAFAINAGPGSVHPLIGCGGVSITTAAWEPVGNLESVVATGNQVEISGWALDPDAGISSIPVHVYVDGRGMGALVAAGSRPDVAAVFPEAGAGHGYRTTMTMSPGQHTVCTFGINVGIGAINPLLGCRSVVV